MNLSQRECLGFSHSNIHEWQSIHSPVPLHPLVFGHLCKMSKDVGVLRYLGGPECRAPSVENHARNNEIGEAQCVGRYVSRSTRHKVRLEVRQGATQALDMLIECLPCAHQILANNTNGLVLTSRWNGPAMPKISCVMFCVGPPISCSAKCTH
jgi:hypothetical protein